LQNDKVDQTGLTDSEFGWFGAKELWMRFTVLCNFTLFRSASLFLIAVLILPTGCSTTILSMKPPPERNPGIVLPIRVVTTLKGKTRLQGHHGPRKTHWETEKISGDMTAWHKDLVTIRSKDRSKTISLDWEFEVPVDCIESIEMNRSRAGEFTTGTIVGILSAGAAYLATLLYLLSQMDFE
jgi:hypothetical protein